MNAEPTTGQQQSLSAAEWETSNDWHLMLHHVSSKTLSLEQGLVFNATLCRRLIWGIMPDESKAIIESAEQWAADSRMPSEEGELCGKANEIVGRLFGRPYPDNVFPTKDIQLQREAACAVCYAVVPFDIWGTVSRINELDFVNASAICDTIRDCFRPFN